MIDLSDIGSSALIVQYEDIVSMIGYNILKNFHGRGINKKLDSMSTKDMLLSYLNREEENYETWLKSEYGIEVNFNDMLKSFAAMQPNLIYTYKVFQYAYHEKRSNLILFSNKYSPIAEQAKDSYGFPGVKYHHSDIISLIKENPNCTYITSDIENIKKCKDIDIPFVLCICDEYLYTSKIFSDNIEKELKEKGNIILRYTNIVSAGVI